MGTQFPGLRKSILFAGDMAIVAASSFIAMNLIVALSGVELDIALYLRMVPVMLGVVGTLLIFDGLLSLKRKSYTEIFIDGRTA